ncbi:MAG TPA: SBBP repeat-containing protein, partial [Thermomicrobiaceae bacterium]|nr:SBBP repeat-containing protein [Thermomicrobiaceae bacterium]
MLRRRLSRLLGLLALLLALLPAAPAAAQEPIIEWTRQFGGGPTSASAIAEDAGGSVYVAGTTWGALPGQTTAGGSDAFVRAHDAHGNVRWSRQFGTSGHDGAAGVAV